MIKTALREMRQARVYQDLQPGVQIIATEDAFFETGDFSQRAGDTLMVNNFRNGSKIVSGTGIVGTAYNGRRCLGLGSSFRVGTFRVATPRDKGFLATREQWLDFERSEVNRLQINVFGCRIVTAASIFAMLLMMAS